MPLPRLVILAALGLAALGCTTSYDGVAGVMPPEVAEAWALSRTPLDRDAGRLAADTERHLEAVRRLRDEIVSAEPPRTVANTLVPLNLLSMHLDAAGNDAQLLSQVHPEEAVRDAALAARQQVAALGTELSLDRALYEAIRALDVSGLDEGTRYAVEKELEDYRRAGVDRDDATRERIAELNDEIIELGQTFSRNIARSVETIEVDHLEGLPDDYVAGHPRNENGKHVIDTTYPDYGPFMRYAASAEDRRRLYGVYMNRAHPENIEVLQQLIAKRHEKARLLGYPHWAEYITEDKMIGSAAAAAEFIGQVNQISRPAAEREYALLLETKRLEDPSATSVADWEKSYWANKTRARLFDFDPKSVRPYFEYETVRKGIFDLTGELFGVRYRPVRGLDLWHEDVEAFDLYEGDRRLGRFYLDMHPRPETDKYGHAACFPYREGVAGAQLPQAVLVCNFPNPRTADKGVALMEFGQVSTFFHEFGHLLHMLFAGQGPWIMNAGISTEWDFVEAPSQMLEEFLYEPEVLRRFARHHETGEPIPVDLVDKLRASADFGKGYGTAHQTFYAALSLNCYDEDPAAIDTTDLVVDLQSRYSLFPHVPGTHFQCNFGHLDGYSAIYYTYKWSEVIAKDMYSRFESEGVLDPEVAREYRETVLEPGSAKPAAELVADFLGREYSFDAFRRWLEDI